MSNQNVAGFMLVLGICALVGAGLVVFNKDANYYHKACYILVTHYCTILFLC